jgi:hypothetical protein
MLIVKRIKKYVYLLQLLSSFSYAFLPEITKKNVDNLPTFQTFYLIILFVSNNSLQHPRPIGNQRQSLPISNLRSSQSRLKSLRQRFE